MRHQLFPLKWINKNVVSSSPISKTNMETSRKFAEEKKERNQLGKGACKVLFSLFGVVKILSFMMIQPPLSSFQYHSSIQSLILTLFDSVLGPKKILRISPANLGYILPAAEFFCPHVRHSNGNILSFWYWNQVIQKPKFIYASRTKTLMKKSKWDKIFLHNRI